MFMLKPKTKEKTMETQTIRFKRTNINETPCYLSKCEEFKVVKYGKNIYAYEKIDSFVNGKKIRVSGNSVEYDYKGECMTYKTYKDAFSAINRIKGA
jgi:hypothetical protein